jgi:hypothetical protein
MAQADFEFGRMLFKRASASVDASAAGRGPEHGGTHPSSFGVLASDANQAHRFNLPAEADTAGEPAALVRQAASRRLSALPARQDPHLVTPLDSSGAYIRGGGLGALAGAGLGAFTGSVLGSEEKRRRNALIGALLGGGLGAATGIARTPAQPTGVGIIAPSA